VAEKDKLSGETCISLGVPITEGAWMLHDVTGTSVAEYWRSPRWDERFYQRFVFPQMVGED